MDMQTIRQNYLIHAPVSKVWDAFVNPKAIESWGAGPNAIMNDKTTKVELLHENVNDKDEKSLSAGWKKFYLTPMKNYLEK